MPSSDTSDTPQWLYDSGRLRDAVAELVPMSTPERLSALRASLSEMCDVAIINKPANIRWLTGFTGSNGLVAVSAERLILATDERYGDQAASQLASAGIEAEIRISRGLYAIVGDQLAAAKVGLEGHHITWDDQRTVQAMVEGGSVVSIGQVIEGLRRHKDPAELARLELACRIADASLAEVLSDFVDGRHRTEHDVAVALERAMAERGAEDRSFPTIVASGANSARPHAQPSNRTVGSGDLLVIDMGAKVDGYGSDMTRSFAVGGFTAETERMYRAVQESQAAGVQSVASGVSANAVHRVTRSVLDEHGLGKYFIHGTGHGIGLEIHEGPFLSSTTDDTLRTGYVVTVEPGVYIPDVGGIRIEDSVLVTEDGNRRLTNHPKDPVLAI